MRTPIRIGSFELLSVDEYFARFGIKSNPMSTDALRVVVHALTDGVKRVQTCTTLGEFLRDNADGMDAGEADLIRDTIAKGGSYTGGGGAAGLFTVEPEPTTTPTTPTTPAAHTPGPLTVRHVPNDYNGSTPYLVESYRGAGLVARATTEANARLIAAAPELLAALINLRGEVLRRRGESLRHPHADQLLEEAAQAIEKSIGLRPA